MVLDFRKIGRWHLFTIWGGLLSTFVALLINYILSDENIISFEIKNDILYAFGRDQILWELDLNTEIKKAILIDLNNDGKNELIVGTGFRGKHPGTVFLINTKRKTIWQINSFPKRFPFIGGHSDKFSISHLSIIKYLTQKFVLVIANDPLWYPARLMLIDMNGKIIGNYWHSGTLGKPYIFDNILDHGRPGVVCIGVNNDLNNIFKSSIKSKYYSVIFLLDPININGQSPPYYGLLTKGGSHLWYKVLLPQGSRIKSIDYERKYNRFRIFAKDGRIFYLSPTGKIIGKAIGDPWFNNYYPFKDSLLDESEFMKLTAQQ